MVVFQLPLHSITVKQTATNTTNFLSILDRGSLWVFIIVSLTSVKHSIHVKSPPSRQFRSGFGPGFWGAVWSEPGVCGPLPASQTGAFVSSKNDTNSVFESPPLDHPCNNNNTGGKLGLWTRPRVWKVYLLHMNLTYRLLRIFNVMWTMWETIYCSLSKNNYYIYLFLPPFGLRELNNLISAHTSSMVWWLVWPWVSVGTVSVVNVFNRVDFKGTIRIIICIIIVTLIL